MSATGDDVLHLPPEIFREILTRLPVKSILRFRSVCKSWYSLVSCPNFISNHSVRNLNKYPNRLLLHLSKDDVCSFSSHNKSFMESREHDEIPESFLGIRTSIVGSCNGLICLMKTDSRHILLDFLIWNPTTRKIVELPSPTCYGYPLYYGFGFDSKTSDYKVLSCTLAEYGSEDEVFQIFDMKKGVWRHISPHCYDPCIVGHSQEFYLDGAVYWSGLEALLSFNLSDECFREISLPDCLYLGDGGSMNIKRVTFGGLVYVIVFWVRHKDLACMARSCSVWTMKEYDVTESWTKVCYIHDLQNAQLLPNNSLSPYQFLLWGEGEVLLVHDLVLYNPGKRSSRCMLPSAKRIRSVCLFEESLVLL